MGQKKRNIKTLHKLPKDKIRSPLIVPQQGNSSEDHEKKTEQQKELIERDLHLSLDELFHGCTKKLKISHSVMDENGRTFSTSDKILTVTVKPGWKEGTRITFPKEGDQGPNNTAADVVFIVRQKPHALFKRVDDDLIYNMQVSLKKALTGFSVEVETLDGRLINIPFNETVYPSYRKVLRGEGMPLPHDPARKGDLIFTFDVSFPENLPADSKRLIKQALTL